MHRKRLLCWKAYLPRASWPTQPTTPIICARPSLPKARSPSSPTPNNGRSNIRSTSISMPSAISWSAASQNSNNSAASQPASKRPPEITVPSSLSPPSSYGCDKCPHHLVLSQGRRVDGFIHSLDQPGQSRLALPLGPGAAGLISIAVENRSRNADESLRVSAIAEVAGPARRRPARPRLGAAVPRSRRARRAEGRGGHGAQGGKSLLLLDRRGVGPHHSARGDRGAPGPAGAEGRGNFGRARRQRDIGPAAGKTHAARRRLDAGAGPGGRAGRELHGCDRRGGI